MRTTNVSRRTFTRDEDARLLAIVREFPSAPWDVIAASMPSRSARQCRERYTNYLDPGLRCAPWTPFEDRLLIDKVNELGHQWASIGQAFQGRGENDVKNRWYSHLKFRSVVDASTGRFTMADEAQDPRKKRQRSGLSPQQKAQLLLNQRAKAATARPSDPGSIAPALCDYWDQAMSRDVSGDFANPFVLPPDVFL
jgi:hypothetical protein